MKPGIVPLRPLGVGEILDGAVTAVRRAPSLLLPSAGVAVVSTLLTFVLQTSLLQVDDSADVSGSEALAVLGGTLLTLAVTSIATLLLAALAAVVVREGMLGRKVTMTEAWRQVRPRFGTVIGAGVLGTLGWVAASITLVGGVFLYVSWHFATVVAVVEGGTVRGVLRRSMATVRTRWWRTLGILLLISLVSGIVGNIISLPFLFIGGGTSSLFGGTSLSTGALAVSDIGHLIASTLITPFTVCAVALLYVDNRMRGEGLDVALRQAASNPS